MKPECVLITGGGTGGHLSPGIALYEEFTAKNIQAYMLAGKRDARFTYLKELGEGHLLLYGAPSFTKNPLKLPFFLLAFGFAVMRAMRIIRKTGAQAVVGMGGYVSGPALIAARFKGVPIYLCEQNTVPGRVTSFFAKKAARVFTTFEATANYFKKDVAQKLLPAGNPIRKKILAQVDRDTARRHFNLRHCKRVVLAIGGSQGALRINELMLGLKRQFPRDFQETGIIWSTGDLSFRKYKDQVHASNNAGSVYMSPFIEEVTLAYRASDLAISRAGSGVMMEIAAMGLPSVLIPFPFAAQDHQDKNADVFAEAGASLKISNSDAAPEKAGPAILELLNNPSRLQRMAARALEVAKPDAAADIVKTIMSDIAQR
ncbi:MAG: UDP-N-acetylglucosamine--N-acetylmuramyl-(pentapeptide) pyrophosphoryl-undecaprenol N-acetylglucosamine transferase [Spirochaetes bacterium]|nr:MAG: UDP-N-acetylglucosamine--N-acetylmuramyl-(pentapeptide) pyrophosphoryl-undecaprenol N-acetylglucosamine transferase [Spirochaetota bacterium]